MVKSDLSHCVLYISPRFTSIVVVFQYGDLVIFWLRNFLPIWNSNTGSMVVFLLEDDREIIHMMLFHLTFVYLNVRILLISCHILVILLHLSPSLAFRRLPNKIGRPSKPFSVTIEYMCVCASVHAHGSLNKTNNQGNNSDNSIFREKLFINQKTVEQSTIPFIYRIWMTNVEL